MDFVKNVPDELVFRKPGENQLSFAVFSSGELILRSGAAVEQTFGGITARLWDDPFEWTLPEELSSTRKIIEYLGEVEQIRKKGLDCFRSDEDLLREIPAPEKPKTIGSLLIETIGKAEFFRGSAQTVFKLVEKEKH
ncbi:MAG: hypothetical protein R2747_04195 [Pyrinomonadaceae bacterium]